ncbi:MAG: HAD-IIB family hydrolase [Longimicrobiales bacterium]
MEEDIETKRATGRLVLATDLDGTMAGGTAEARARLTRELAAHGATTLIYVTGRTPEAARTLLAEAALPEPEVLVADVGSSVLRGAGPTRITEIEAALSAGWPGARAVRERLAPLIGTELTPQDVDAPRRVSYWIEPVRRRRDRGGDDAFAALAPDDAAFGEEAAVLADEVARRARARLEDMSVDILVSANVFLDVLPRGVNKGTTLRRVLDWLGASDDDCVVAGDSLNDLALFETGFRGILVGNCEPGLRGRVGRSAGVYQARGHGAAGLLEGLRHHGHLGNGRAGGGRGE